jgi:hypothetical protein
MTNNKRWIETEGYESVRPTRLYKGVGYKTKKSRRGGSAAKAHRKFWNYIRTHLKGTD